MLDKGKAYDYFIKSAYACEICMVLQLLLHRRLVSDAVTPTAKWSVED